MNEACLNFLDRDIGTPAGQRFALRVMDFLRETIAGLQAETGSLFNLEATPARAPLSGWPCWIGINSRPSAAPTMPM
jgi:anaerobic ribonucleoside-triphosphate reductase